MLQPMVTWPNQPSKFNVNMQHIDCVQVPIYKIVKFMQRHVNKCIIKKLGKWNELKKNRVNGGEVTIFGSFQ